MKNKIDFILIAILFLFIISCDDHISPTLPSDETPTPEPTTISASCTPGNVAYETINTPALFNGPNYYVAKTYEECAMYFGEDFAKTIDFDKKIVIGVVAINPDLCHYSKITRVTTDCNEITINVFRNIPCMTACAMVVTTSIDIITIDKTTLPIKFIDEYNNCFD